MSKTVDQRVVEMQFDNKNFERNVSTTMSTLDKLKEKLNFTNTGKGLENIGAAASKVNMNGLASGVELVHSRFSALEVMGVTALANITNSAVNAGKRITKALTIDPVKSGFNEFELKMGSIQTIMASTGESLETVNQYLEELNRYSDQTIYSFQDMTQNIGKFTNAGVKLEDAVMAIKGISNEAAVSGANANEASRAMYNFAQALSAGYVKLIDWKSIENANMATVEFKKQLIETALEMGTVTKAADGMYKTLDGNLFNSTKSFNEVFDDQWMTSEVLINTLKKYADETTKIGKKASAAATEVKTFSMMMDTLKESLQSGWARTWEIIIGDFEQGKKLWTNISGVLGGMIDKFSDARNNLLDGALNGGGGGSIDTSLWAKLAAQISETGVSVEEFQNGLIETAEEHGIAVRQMIKEEGSFLKTLKNGWLTKDIFSKTLKKFTDGLDGLSKSTEATTDQLKYFQKMFDEVWSGNWGNGVDRFNKLTEAGHDYAAIQKLVNEHTAGYKLTLEDLSDEQLKSVGYTDEQIEAFRKLAEEAEKTGTPLNELMESMTKPTGRELILESFRHLLEELQKPLNAVKEAWNNVFGDGMTSLDLYGMIEQFHEFATSIEITTETAGKLEKVFEGLFYGGKLLKSVMGTSLVAMLNLASAVLKLFGTNMLDLSANIAEYIISFGKWVEEHTLFIDMMDKVAKILHAVIDGIGRCVQAFIGLDVIKSVIDGVGKSLAVFFGNMGEGIDSVNIDNFVKKITDFFTGIENWIKGLKDSKNLSEDIANGITNAFLALPGALVKIVTTIRTQLIAGFNSIPTDIITGLAEGLWNGVKIVGQAILELAQTLVDKACEVLGINSPSKVFFAIGGFIIAGLLNGLMNGNPEIKAKVESIVATMVDIFQSIDWGAVLIAGFGVGILLVGKKFADILDKIVSPLEHVNNVLKSVSGMFDSVSSFFKTLGTSLEKYINAASLNKKAIALKNIAIAIVILAGAVAVIALLNKSGVGIWGAVGVIMALAVIIGGLAAVVGKFGPKETVELSKFGAALLAMSTAILIIAGAIKLISDISVGDLAKGVIAIGFLGAIMAGLIYSTKWFDKESTKIGGTLLKMTIVLLMMVGVVKLASSIESSDLVKGIAAIIAFGGILVGFTAMSKLFNKDAGKLGGSLFKMAAAILVLIGITKVISTMRTEDLIRGGIAIIAFGGIMVGLIAATSLFDKKAEKVGGTLLKMSAAILLLVVVAKLISTMNSADLAKGVVGVGLFGAVVVALVKATSLAGGKDLKRVGSTILMLAVAIGVLAGVSAIMGLMKIENLVKGVAAVSILSGMVALLVKATEKAQDIKGTLVGFAIAIGTMVAAIVVLSFLDPADIAIGVTALTVLMGTFSVLIKSTKALKGVNKLVSTLLPLIGVVAILAGIVAAMTLLDTDDVVKSSASISILLLSLSASMALIGKAGPVAKNAVGTLALMGLVVAELGLILGLMSYFNVEASLQTATALSMLLLAMSGALAILSYAAPTAMAGVGALAVMGLVVAELAVILGLMSYFDVQPSIETAGALSILLLAMSGALVLLGAVGAMGPAAFIGIGALATLIAGIGTLIVGIGALVTEFPKLEEFLNTGIPIIEKIGYAIGSFFGNIVGGFGEGMTSGLPAMAEDLRNFVSTLGMIDPEAMEGVKTLASALLTLTATNFIDTIASWITGGSGKDLAEFGNQIGQLAVPLKAFVDNLGGFTEEQLASVKNAAKALELMAEAASNVNGQAEWSKSVFGDNSIVAFATEIKDFIASMAGVGTFNDDQIKSVKNAAKALDVMADAAKGADGQAEWSKKVFGDNSITAFAGEIKKFISSMNGLGTFTSEQVDTLKRAAKGIKEMNKIAKDLDGQAGWSKKVFGDNSLTAFATDIKGFVSTIGELDTTVLTEFSDALNELGESTVKEFIDGFEDADSDVEDGAEDLVDTFIDAIEDEYSDMKAAGKYLVQGFAKGISNNSSIAKAAAREVAKAAAKAAEDALDINSPSRVGIGIGDFFGLGFVKGIRNYIDVAYSTASDMATSARDGLNKTVSKIKNVLDLGDVDTQPVISPVLDLTNVRSGASTIGNLLTAGGPIDVLANVRSANMMMNQRNQNGMNDDVISAINALRGELGNLSNTTYQINGVTYDDGSNITDAVRTIVRYAKIGGRV